MNDTETCQITPPEKPPTPKIPPHVPDDPTQELTPSTSTLNPPPDVSTKLLASSSASVLHNMLSLTNTIIAALENDVLTKDKKKVHHRPRGSTEAAISLRKINAAKALKTKLKDHCGDASQTLNTLSTAIERMLGIANTLGQKAGTPMNTAHSEHPPSGAEGSKPDAEAGQLTASQALAKLSESDAQS